MDKLFIPPDGIEIDSFHFDETRQIIEVVKRLPSNEIYASNPPRPAPDTVWKEIYGIKDGKLALLEKIQGTHTPRSINPEKIEFENE